MKKLICLITALLIFNSFHLVSADDKNIIIINFFEAIASFEEFAQDWRTNEYVSSPDGTLAYITDSANTKLLNTNWNVFETTSPFCFEPVHSKKNIINVTATTLWLEPNESRAIDQSSLNPSVNLAKWTSSMNLDEKLWLVGKIETQALYGQEVTILQKQGDWLQIAVNDQSTPKNSSGYPGWVPSSHILEHNSYYETCSIAIIDVKTTALFDDPQLDNKYMDLSFNTRLPIIEENERWVKVHTPTNGFKYLDKKSIQIYENVQSIPKPTQVDIVKTATKFIGLPYIWAGTSGFGFDCSGFTHSIYKRHGILIPRDASAQIKEGKPIDRNDLQPGDLMFFAYNNGAGKVHHVGMYIGNGQMIHSPNSNSSVEIISIEATTYKSEFAGARRYL